MNERDLIRPAVLRAKSGRRPSMFGHYNFRSAHVVACSLVISVTIPCAFLRENTRKYMKITHTLSGNRSA